MYVFRKLTDYSYPAIAKEFGGRDHTTVMHAVEKIGSLMGERRQIFDQVTELIVRIKTGHDPVGHPPAPCATVTTGGAVDTGATPAPSGPTGGQPVGAGGRP